VLQENGRPIREFELAAKALSVSLAGGLTYKAWAFNGMVPGPTLRAQAGERIRVWFENQDGRAHSVHFHGLHPAEVDGILPIRRSRQTIYEFDAEPAGLHLYHCHVEPVSRHISKGLYGLFIVDPPEARPPGDELCLVLHGFEFNNEGRNRLYGMNGQPHAYHHEPIRIRSNQLVRLYLLNLAEYEPVLSFHLHANMFGVIPTGMGLTPSWQTDIITLGPAERTILEFRYTHPGIYMFHPHQDWIAERGCMGAFEVI
jgi:FtsP/CotA-like multicopper oxidase with cupredoxin domain